MKHEVKFFFAVVVLLVASVSLCLGNNFEIGSKLEQIHGNWKAKTIAKTDGFADSAVWLHSNIKLARVVALEDDTDGSQVGFSYSYCDENGRLVSRTIHFGKRGLVSRSETVSGPCTEQTAETASSQNHWNHRCQIRTRGRSASSVKTMGKIDF